MYNSNVAVNFEHVTATIKNHSDFIWNVVSNEVLKSSDLYFEFINFKTPESEISLIQMILGYIANVSQSDYQTIVDQLENIRLSNEVSEHFTQDKNPLQLEQEFDSFIESNISNWMLEDKLELYRNEY